MMSNALAILCLVLFFVDYGQRVMIKNLKKKIKEHEAKQ